MAVLRKLLQLILFLVVLQIGSGTTTTQEVRRLSQLVQALTTRVEALEDDVEEMKNSTLAMMDILVIMKEDLAALRQEGSQERAEVNATVSKIQETLEDDNLIMNSVRDASQKHQQFTTEQFSNISEEIQDIRQSFLGLASQCDTSSPVTECYPLISVQYLPTSCSELATSSRSGYYWIYYNHEARIYCDFLVTSQQNPAPSCEHIATHYSSTPSGYYWVGSSNGSAVNVYCHMMSQQDPAPSCEYIAETHPSTPSGYYWVRSSNDSAVNVYCSSQQDPAPSCQYIAETHPSAPSGYYWVRSSNGSAVNVYCDNHLTSSEDPSHSCQDIAETHPSAPSGYYWVGSSSSALNVYCNNHLTSSEDPAPSCQYIAETHPSAPSGYYWVRSSNGSAVNVSCDMARHCCGSAGGWMRVAYLNMTDTSQQCPEGFTLRSEPKRTCELIIYSGCTYMFYHSHHIQYSKVCGRVRAYQYGGTPAFARYFYGFDTTIDSSYVDGMSITHGESQRKHIWTFAAAMDEIRYDQHACPCTRTDARYTGRVPPFIGNDYFCDTGSREGFQYDRFYSQDPLWDGEGCGPTSSCCQLNPSPWFCKELPQPTTDDVEVRVCRYDASRDTPFELIELYVQ